MTVGTGIKLNSIEIGSPYNLGLANISQESASGVKIFNRVLGISVGYLFEAGRKSEPFKEKTPAVKPGGRKAAAIEAERLRIEKK